MGRHSVDQELVQVAASAAAWLEARGMSFSDVIAAVAAERAAQDLKWGPSREQPSGVWYAILSEEVGEVAEALLDQEYFAHEP